ncbi:hypothetical protein FACS1894111_06000 [Clostridia bacterium]|nr:hypothetical protein FACS1894111_06000 [Clostridia bacterium]
MVDKTDIEVKFFLKQTEGEIMSCLATKCNRCKRDSVLAMQELEKKYNETMRFAIETFVSPLEMSDDERKMLTEDNEYGYTEYLYEKYIKHDGVLKE